ncbi:thermonuclease family protein [Novosphingopyxis sp. YJ-S2-01]|uniref:thermonuclease family protein n=1 Tax=Novosphingopyxis sp. YJ-S2-01 TaxID=2794021 RepID=UPI002FC3D7CC
MVDGDTAWVNGEKIRLANIDAPEIRGKCSSERALAIAARNRLATLLRPGFQIHRTGTDRYGRTLARITVDGVDVGRVLVVEGLAREWTSRREPWC